MGITNKPFSSSSSSSASTLSSFRHAVPLLLLLLIGSSFPFTQAVDHSGNKPAGSLEDVGMEFYMRTASLKYVMEVFKRLHPPAEPLCGEYVAELLDAGSDFDNLLAYTGFYNPEVTGFWIGKGFVPSQGYGYNLFLESSELHRKYKMLTSYNESIWDNKTSYVLDYRQQNHLLGFSQMRDEVRELQPGLYLGIGAWGWTEARRNRPSPFLLRGPKNDAQPQFFQEEELLSSGGHRMLATMSESTSAGWQKERA